MARPVKPVDLSLVEKLAAINCSMDEIASAVNVTRRTLQTRYCAAIEKGRSNGKVSLKRKMYETAMNGNITMMIWLSKQMLGYADKVEQVIEQSMKEKIQFNVKWADEQEQSNPSDVEHAPPDTTSEAH